MTLHIFFLTITINKRALNHEELERARHAEAVEEEMMNRRAQYPRWF
ncbi:YrzI family small protein [Priestia koreensis]|nr:YrzI family small protein [Priestia koreensis]MCM3002575.1 YrzI family small protein [Priestia koreensis]UNL84282.1 YrzI family small protein [Priestia koreensis]